MLFVYVLYAYLIIGFIVAISFCFLRIEKIDEGAIHTGIGFKLLLLPAALLLWPLILKRMLLKKQAA